MMKPANTENLRVAKVEMVNGAPALTVDGRPIPMMAWQWRLDQVIDDDPAHDTQWQIDHIADAGVELYFTRFLMNDPKNFEDNYDIFMREMKILTDRLPDALVMPWIMLRPYDNFGKKFPEDVIRFDDGRSGGWSHLVWTGLKDLDTPRYSFASNAWKCEVSGMLREFMHRLYASPYARNIIGYFFFIFDQESSWFFGFDGRVKCIDFSPAMKRAFREYLLEKYHGDEMLLRAAWKDDTATFEDPAIPSLQQRIHGDFGYFRDPAESMQVYDYVACHNEVVAEKMMYLGRVVKEESDYKAVMGTFWGYYMNQDLQMGGQTQVKKMMDSPYVDIWSSPFTYENRCAGNFASLRMMLQSLNRHGKLYFAETDTFLSDSPNSALEAHNYPPQTWDEDVGTLLRDFAYPFCEGCNGWWLDWCGGLSMYDKNGMQPYMHKIREISEKGFTLPRGPVSDIAGVIDQESMHVPACNSRNHADNDTMSNAVRFMQHSLDRYRVFELPRLGTPVDFYETDDVLDEGSRKYKMYIFINQYMADERERELIEKKLKKDGNMLVWMYGSGLIDGGELDLKNAERLTGFRLGCEMKECRAVMKARNTDALPGMKAGEMLGDYLRPWVGRRNDGKTIPEPNLVNPRIYVDDLEAIPLADFIEDGRVGFAMKKFDDWTSVYIGSVCMQAHILQALAKLAGAHLFVEGEEIIFANESYLSIHAQETGVRTFHLKGKADVVDALDGRVLATNSDTFMDDVPKHATRIYQYRK